MQRRIQDSPIRFLTFSTPLLAIALYCGGGISDTRAAAEFTKPDSAQRQDDGSYISQDAKVVLEWTAAPPDPEAIFELQQAEDPSFSDPLSKYEGSDLSTVLTGLAEGTYYFRIRIVAEGDLAWSEPLQVRVEFMERKRFLLFLGAGCIVTVMTLGAILIGHFRTSQS